MDYNIDSRNRLSLRHNWVDASKDNFYNSSSLNFSFPDKNDTFNSNTHIHRRPAQLGPRSEHLQRTGLRGITESCV